MFGNEFFFLTLSFYVSVCSRGLGPMPAGGFKGTPFYQGGGGGHGDGGGGGGGGQQQVNGPFGILSGMGGVPPYPPPIPEAVPPYIWGRTPGSFKRF